VPIDLRTGTIGKPISKVANCQSISTGDNRQTLSVASCGDNGNAFNTVLPVSVKTGAAGAPITVPGFPARVFRFT